MSFRGHGPTIVLTTEQQSACIEIALVLSAEHPSNCRRAAAERVIMVSFSSNLPIGARRSLSRNIVGAAANGAGEGSQGSGVATSPSRSRSPPSRSGSIGFAQGPETLHRARRFAPGTTAICVFNSRDGPLVFEAMVATNPVSSLLRWRVSSASREGRPRSRHGVVLAATRAHSARRAHATAREPARRGGIIGPAQ